MDMFAGMPKPSPEEVEESATEALIKFEKQFDSIYEKAEGIENPTALMGALGLGIITAMQRDPMFVVEFATLATYKLIQAEREAEEMEEEL